MTGIDARGRLMTQDALGRFMGWFLALAFGFAAAMMILLLAAVGHALIYGERTKIIIDRATGCEYVVSEWREGITPRMNKDGKHVCR